MYEVRYGRSNVMHISGLPEATKASADGMRYAASACPAVSGLAFFATTTVALTTDDLAAAIAAARSRGRLCASCTKAADRAVAAKRATEPPAESGVRLDGDQIKALIALVATKHADTDAGTLAKRLLAGELTVTDQHVRKLVDALTEACVAQYMKETA